ncbi:beta-galactosidase [Mesobacillus subterraneus]|uniref:Glycosyl hydrolase n=1 Tax=Mesobacillus subterraneus TaxID=285983 RepID=A0A0D6ZEL3_9BACI|nr:beta-galactosidase [Mesobacillus subterraneus]KIY23526.1 glycosyl hydrolase [Mesobacillus subterraneus]
MIEIKDKQIVIDGKPELIMAGEIHYFRLPPSEWQDRLDKLKLAGCNAVSTYVPWLIHEPTEGKIDLIGKTRPELDLKGFIELCEKNDFYFFLRPGPFIMAEMKNEGLPFWIYEKYPEVIPTGWNKKTATTKTIDYLAPRFLNAAKKWYKAVVETVTPHLHQNGGKIIAFQLDNEIGMLSWVSNTPDLTENVLMDFAAWLEKEYKPEVLSERYPFDLREMQARNNAIRSPKESYAPQLMKDLGYYMRNRFARYVATLRGYAEEYGVKNIPFVVNIHGTGGLRGFTFPIGISQLYESYTQGPGYLSGSDIYFGDLEMNNFQDLYLINGFMDSVHLPDQPLTSVEFNCGDGNFGNTYGGRYDPSAADLKARMCIAQGNRMINYYLFTGGYNFRWDVPLNDGNDRIAFTGERHGFAAPVSPEGELNYTFPRMARGIRTIMAVAEKAAAMDEERDDVKFAFIPDYYMTEYRYAKSEKMAAITANLEANRASGSWEMMARGMLLSGYRFGATDIQNRPLSPKETPVLALPSARYMSANIQLKLVEYMETGGGVLLYGEVPQYDMEGKDCTILADAFGVKHKGILRDSGEFYLSLYADGWAAPRPEIRSYFAQVFDVDKTTPLFRVYGTDEVCGFQTSNGKGGAIVIAGALPGDFQFIKEALERLGAKAKLTHDFKDHGIFMTSTANKEGERFIHLLNLDGFDKSFHICEQGTVLFGGKEITLQCKEGVMLPFNMAFGNRKIVWSTAEIIAIKEDSIEFRLTQNQDVIAFKAGVGIKPSENYELKFEETLVKVISKNHSKVNDQLIVHFA